MVESGIPARSAGDLGMGRSFWCGERGCVWESGGCRKVVECMRQRSEVDRTWLAFLFKEGYQILKS